MGAMCRRQWLAAFAASSAFALDGGAVQERGGTPMAGDALREAVEETPNYLAHEHWGSLTAVGGDDTGFRADNLAGAWAESASLFDLLLDPYLHGFLAAAGCDTSGLARAAGYPDIFAMARARPEETLAALQPHLLHQRSTGTLICLREGIRALYGYDLDDLPAGGWRQLSNRVGEHYRQPFRWYREAMATARLEGILRPVALSHFLQDAGDPALAEEERAFTGGLLRIDDFAQATRVPNARVRYAIAKTGIEPRDVAGWRQLLEAVFELAERAGCRGIKQMQAYRRDLDFRPVADAEVDLTGANPRPFEDFVVRECTRLAAEREWPFQIHVGTNNLPASSPLPLARLATEFPRVRFVLIHCWPYLDESAYLAKMHANIGLDTCWLPVLSPGHLARALGCFLGYVPSHKLMASQDATSVEMAVGASGVTRRMLGSVLAEQVAEGLYGEAHAAAIARAVLCGNAREWYRI